MPVCLTTCIFKPMKKNIIWIIALMSVCVLVIIGLQLFWNYRNYKSTVKDFSHDVNEALRVAVDKEIDLRQLEIIEQFKKWLNDTTIVQISCDTNNRQQETVFHVEDTHPYKKGDKGFSISVNHFKEKLNRITPEAKRFFIDHFGNNIARSDLKKGTIYYYTQRLGDRLRESFFTSRLDTTVLAKIYKEELKVREIDASFIFNVKRRDSGSFITEAVNTSMRRPYEVAMITAGFETPNSYYIKEMGWLVITTFLLIAITVFCFAYTTRTLLSQHKLSELRNAFINNMTHELNTPLASIKITVEALNRFSHDPRLLRDYLGIIHYQTDKLSDLAAQILNAGKLIHGDKDAWTNIDLNEVLKEAIQTLSPQLKEKDIRVFYDPVELPRIKGDRAALLNAFINIIDNAVKYNHHSRPVLAISARKAEKYVLISFADNGPGIPPDYRKRIFEEFFRIPEGNQHNVKGYGLGLSYVNQVIKQHRGVVSVSNNDPQGSIFTIKLPVSNGKD
jgi:two-component system phosphate regulon sensor histidine kinase PhoR